MPARGLPVPAHGYPGVLSARCASPSGLCVPDVDVDVYGRCRVSVSVSPPPSPRPRTHRQPPSRAPPAGAGAPWAAGAGLRHRGRGHGAAGGSGALGSPLPDPGSPLAAAGTSGCGRGGGGFRPAPGPAPAPRGAERGEVGKRGRGRDGTGPSCAALGPGSGGAGGRFPGVGKLRSRCGICGIWDFPGSERGRQRRGMEGAGLGSFLRPARGSPRPAATPGPPAGWQDGPCRAGGCSSARCPCPRRGKDETEWSLRTLPSQTIPSFSDPMKYSERRDSSPCLQQSPPQFPSLQCTRRSQFSKPGQPALGLELQWIPPFSTQSSAVGVKHYPTSILAVGGVCCSPPDDANAGSRDTFSSRQAQSKDPLQGVAQSAGLCFPSSGKLDKDTTDLSAPGIMAQHPHSASSSLISIPTCSNFLLPVPTSSSLQGNEQNLTAVTRDTSRHTEAANPSLHQHISSPAPHPSAAGTPSHPEAQMFCSQRLFLSL